MDTPESLERRAEKAAEKAECTRCRAVIWQEGSRTGLTWGSFTTPVLGILGAENPTLPFQLCGKCALALREFLTPALEGDPIYREIKAKLLEVWS